MQYQVRKLLNSFEHTDFRTNQIVIAPRETWAPRCALQILIWWGRFMMLMVVHRSQNAKSKHWHSKAKRNHLPSMCIPCLHHVSSLRYIDILVFTYLRRVRPGGTQLGRYQAVASDLSRHSCSRLLRLLRIVSQLRGGCAYDSPL